MRMELEKKVVFVILLIICTSVMLNAQQFKVGKNVNSLKPSVVLELEDPNQAFLLTRVFNPSTAIATPYRGMIVFDSSVSKLSYYDGAKWQYLVASDSNIYNYDGTLIANRRVILNGKTLAFVNPATDSVYFTNGKVGININPQSALHVKGAIRADSAVFTNLPFRGNGLTSDSILVVGSDGQVKRMDKTQITSKNIYNSNDTINANRTVVLNNKTLAFKTNTTDSVWLSNTDSGQLNLRGSSIKARTIAINDMPMVYFDNNTNMAFGNGLRNNTTGNYNMANGYQALYSNTMGSANTANGYQALHENTGSANTANGYEALYNNTTGGSNTANGTEALYSNTTGSSNMANGYGAIFFNSTGSNNTANGIQTLYFNTTGGWNTANGYRALFNNTTGNKNTAIGDSAGYNLTTGSNNIAIGNQTAIPNNANNQLNIGNSIYGLNIGQTTPYIGINTLAPISALHVKGALRADSAVLLQLPNVSSIATTDSLLIVDNIGIVKKISASSTGKNIYNSNDTITANRTVILNNKKLAFKTNTTDSVWLSNTDSGQLNLRGTSIKARTIAINNIPMVYFDNNTNMAFGNGLRKNTTGNYNMANGYQALYNNTTGNENTANGSGALYSNTTGSYNMAIGYGTLTFNTTGDFNTANGYGALASNTTGSYNEATGYYSLIHNTTGGGNTANGDWALYNNTTGNKNIAIGDSAGFNLTTGSNNIAIGSYTIFPNITADNQLNIGNSIYGLNMGTATATPYIGINTLTPISALHVNGAIRADSAVLLKLPNVSNVATTDSLLIVDNIGIVKKISASSVSGNIYTADGTLGMNRIVTMNDKNLTFSSTTGNLLFVPALTGKVGIKVFNPTHTLTVNGGIRADSIVINSDKGIYTTAIYGNLIRVYQQGAVDAVDFYTSGVTATNANPKMTLLNTGFVGIGTTTPAQKLDVNGTAKANNLQLTSLSTGLITDSILVINNNDVKKIQNNVGWSLTGNSGTTAGTNFIGTTDNQDVVFKRSNGRAGLLSINNTSFGVSTLNAVTTGSWNTTVGSEALRLNTTGSNNTGIGYQALTANTTGSNNTGIGYQALFANTGSNNTVLGMQAGNTLTTGSNNIMIGYQTNVPSPTTDYQLSIGNSIYGQGMGGSGSKIGINTSILSYNFQVNGTAAGTSAWVVTSDMRLKKNIIPLDSGISKIMQLRPVSYEKKRELESIDYEYNEMGFIAQEVRKVLPMLVTEAKDSAKILSLNYNGIIPMLTKAMQEQQAQINNQQKQIDELKAMLQQLLKK